MADTHGANGIIGRLRRPGKNRLNPELTLLGTDLQRADCSDAEEFAAFGSSPEFFHRILTFISEPDAFGITPKFV
jgi:hypothetical protein